MRRHWSFFRGTSTNNFAHPKYTKSHFTGSPLLFDLGRRKQMLAFLWLEMSHNQNTDTTTTFRSNSCETNLALPSL